VSGGGLRGEGLVYVRAGRRILDGVDLEVRRGERLAVTGPSGAGKSTLLAIVAGLEASDAGRVTLDGEVLRSGVDPALRRRVGVVLQGYGLLSLLSAAENVELALQSRGLGRRDVRAKAHDALTAVGLAARAEHLVEELSGGEQQRVAIARALVGEPEVLLADEPTAELDAENRERILQLLLGLADRGAAVVLATHDPDVAMRCDRRVHLDAGLLAEAPVEFG
jgi:predicted ABC-type transport system involved in lysophospholipase L1 biosynthesis ATPase subunit